jgi:hypothetical protein
VGVLPESLGHLINMPTGSYLVCQNTNLGQYGIGLLDSMFNQCQSEAE